MAVSARASSSAPADTDPRAAAIARVRQLALEVRQHKRAIANHRSALQAAKAALDTAQAHCRDLGIAVALVP
jgi:hypothetical protein